MLKLSTSFLLETASRTRQGIPFNTGKQCLVFIGGEQVLDGWVEVLNVDGAKMRHKVEYIGRDKTGDLVDSNLNHDWAILDRAWSVKALCEKIIAGIGLDIKVIDEVSPTLLEPGENLQSPSIGDGAFDYLEKMARTKQVLLTSNELGDLVITRGLADKTSQSLRPNIINMVGGKHNNVLQYSFTNDERGRYNSYEAANQYNLSAGFNLVDTIDMVDVRGRAIDDTIGRKRQMVINAENIYDIKQAVERAVWERNIRASKGMTYRASLPSFFDEHDNLWRKGMLVHVQDEMCEVDQEMLISAVVYTNSGDTGKRVDISCVHPDSYTLNAETPVVRQFG